MISIKFHQVLATSRPKFLVLTLCCLSLALATVVAENITINYLHVALVYTGALAAHASVNMLNEYQDFTSGLDFQTHRTPFSGGSGTLPMAPELAKLVQLVAIGSLVLTILIGFYLLSVSGWSLLLIGLPGILLVYFYTDKITHSPMLCLIAPGLAFGPLMINGAYYVLSGHYSVAVFFTSLIVFFLVNNLLLLNQFPDLEADKNSGRHHLPILIGRKKSAWVYVGFLTASYAVLLLNVALSFLPVYSLLGLLSLPLAIFAATMIIRYADELDKLKSALALNVIIALATPVLVSIGIVLQ